MTYFKGYDFYCGAGGVTEGLSKARYNGERIAHTEGAVNHDHKSIASHSANHINTMHFIEDMRRLELKRLPPLKAARTFIWASLECTNFSNAKGGMPRDADSRTLAEDMVRYFEFFMPDYGLFENVREFLAWGPLNDQGKPVSRKRGRDYLSWVESIKALGYEYDYRLLNAADFGAYTSRIRYFGLFAKKGRPIAFPVATHSRNPEKTGLLPWKAVRDVLDLNDEGNSIFQRKKPLVERTLKRILAGLEKYVANGDTEYLQSYYGNGDNCRSIDQPAGTVTTKDRISKVVSVQWLDKCYSGENNHQSIKVPSGSLTTKDKFSLCSPQFMIKQWTGDENHQTIDQPCCAVTTRPGMQFVTATNFDNKPVSLDRPLSTITANRKYHYLVNPQFQSPGGSVESPCFTLIARMDKKPPGIITVDRGNVCIHIFPEDSPTMVKIKQFMAAYGLIDIKMRMLNIPELKRIMGLPENYILKGTKSDQKRSIGNAVHTKIPKAWFERLYEINNGIHQPQYDHLPLMQVGGCV